MHGAGSYRVPWLYDEEAVDVLRFFVRLKCTLMPYLFAAAAEAHTAGVPLMRAMMLEFPADRAVEYLDRQYMLGGSILVAPVFSPDGSIVVLGADETLTEYDYTDSMTVHVYEPAVGETITAAVAPAANDGSEPVGITAEYADGAVTVALSRALPRWTAVVHRAGKTFAVAAGDGATGRTAAKSVRVDVRGE